MDKELKEMLNNPKFLYTLVIICSIFFVAIVADGYISYNTEDPINYNILDQRFDEVKEEVDGFGGSMIVTYDEKTGEILGKRSGVKVKKQAGAFTITRSEYENNNKKFPGETIIISDDLTPQQAIEYGGNI